MTRPDTLAAIERRNKHWAEADFDGSLHEHPDTECSADRDRSTLLALLRSEAGGEGLREAALDVVLQRTERRAGGGMVLTSRIAMDRLAAALEAEPMTSGPRPLSAPTFAWLIERGQPEQQVPTVWWSDRKRWGLTYMDDWTTEAFEAFRFDSREEAEAVIAGKFTPPVGEPSARAVEHGFLAALPSTPSPEGLDVEGLREARSYEEWVGRIADALHETCRLEWQAMAVVDPTRAVTQHFPDAHWGTAHDLVRRLNLALFPSPEAERTEP